MRAAPGPPPYVRLVPLALCLLVVVSAVACDDPALPAPRTLEIHIVSGASQRGRTGEALPEPLRVLVRARTDGRATAGVAVSWVVESGAGAELTADRSVTDAKGEAETRLTLGPLPGPYRVRATLEDHDAPGARFEVLAVAEPRIASVDPPNLAAGDLVTLVGEHFDPLPSENLVLFDGVRGIVVTASSTRLVVRVPSCLRSGSVNVSVAVAGFEGEAVPALIAAAPALDLGVGRHVRMTESAEALCFRLSPEGGASYLAVVQSASTGAGGLHDVQLLVPGGTGRLEAHSASSSARSGGPGAEWVSSAQDRWDRVLREREQRMARGARLPPVEAPAPVGALTPEVGERRTFRVLNAERQFDQVTAVVRHVSEQAVLYEDVTAPEGGFTDADLHQLAAIFDDVIHPTVTNVYGSVSDLDGNGRVSVLLTPTVNRLSEADSEEGVVGGFFFGLDLMRGNANSNEGEIFYALVPDPEGTLGNVLTRERLLAAVPAILAHEFQHMVHFNERILFRGAPSTDALWLSEALAQMAETVVAEELEARGRSGEAERFHAGNLDRAFRYLGRTADASLLVSSGSGTLEERGAGWLFLRYLRGQAGTNRVLGRLTQTTRSGIPNVEAETGRLWFELLATWAMALYVDGGPLDRDGNPHAGLDPAVTFPDFDLRAALSRRAESFPLAPAEVPGDVTFTWRGTLASSSTLYFVMTPALATGLTVSLSGPGGRRAEGEAGLQLAVIRLH